MLDSFNMKKRKLSESYGVFEGCEELAIKIFDELFWKWQKEWEKDYNFILKPIDVPCWFANDGLVHIYPTGLPLRAGCGIDLDKTEGKIKIFVNPNNVEWYSEDDEFISSLMHELTHAYRAIMKSRVGRSEHETAEKEGYYKNFDYMFKTEKSLKTNLKTKLSDFIYTSSQIELPAFIAGMYGGLSNAGRHTIEIDTVDEALEVIHRTKEYKRFVRMFFLASELTNYTDRNTQNQLVMYANDLTAMEFRTYAQLKKWITNRYDKVSKKLKTLIPKMIYKYFETDVD